MGRKKLGGKETLGASIGRTVAPRLEEFEVVLGQADLSGAVDYYVCIGCRRGAEGLVCGAVSDGLNGFFGVN